MPYSVSIEFLDDVGAKVGPTTTRRFETAEIAVQFMRRAIELAEPLNEAVMFRLQDPHGNPLMSCSTKWQRKPIEAANWNDAGRPSPFTTKRDGAG